MLIRILRTESPLQFIYILMTGVLLWLPAFWASPSVHPACSPLPFYQEIFSALDHPQWLIPAISLLMIMIQGIVFTLILSRHNLTQRNNAFPAIIYMLLMGWHPDMLTLHPSLITNSFLILFLFYFLQVNEKDDPFKEVFSASLCLALATFFNLPLASLMILIWMGFMVYRVLSWREWVISLIGFGIPWVYLLFIFNLNDHLGAFIFSLNTFMSSLHFLTLSVNAPTLISLVLLLLFLLAAVLRIMGTLQERVISIRKKFSFLIWFFFLSLPVFLLAGHQPWTQSSTAMIPATALISFHLLHIKKRFWWELMFSIFVLGLIGMRIL